MSGMIWIELDLGVGLWKLLQLFRADLDMITWVRSININSSQRGRQTISIINRCHDVSLYIRKEFKP